MKNQNKNLLPGIISEWDALTSKLSKIKLRSFVRFTKLVQITFILFTLCGYYPTLTIPPFQKSLAQASPLRSEVNPEQKGEIIAEGFSQPLVLPHPGYLSTRFSSYHPGIDIAAGLGMPVHPIIEGEVLATGRDFFGLGNFIEIAHENNFKSKYAHLGRIYVKAGQKVTSENILGEVGLTGYTSGPHTHLEITYNGKYIDPEKLLPEIPNMPFDSFDSTQDRSAQGKPASPSALVKN